ANGTTDQEPGRPTDRRSTVVDSLVEALDNADQADGIDVPHRPDPWVGARAHVVAGQREDVANSQRMHSQQVRLQRHEIAVSTREMEKRFEANLLLGQYAQR